MGFDAGAMPADDLPGKWKRQDFHFGDEDMGRFTREMSSRGIEKTPDEWRDYLIFCCELHCREHPEHRSLPSSELWQIVDARINDHNDPFPIQD